MQEREEKRRDVALLLEGRHTRQGKGNATDHGYGTEENKKLEMRNGCFFLRSDSSEAEFEFMNLSAFNTTHEAKGMKKKAGLLCWVEKRPAHLNHTVKEIVPTRDTN
ncbi:unnamed protein product [Sphenostylis stenocarpa]|uniref:Uncharacterized protein n=1 Tax=Sphenostylis stenocarpa TaxID=92480 RepID=A0AA86T2X6_9FABA|nr:unnamed protein product [Sphenostylis stenocarpa]